MELLLRSKKSLFFWCILDFNVETTNLIDYVLQGTVDAIVEAAHLVSSLQTVISRNKDPLESGVLTCGTIEGGLAYELSIYHNFTYIYQ